MKPILVLLFFVVVVVQPNPAYFFTDEVPPLPSDERALDAAIAAWSAALGRPVSRPIMRRGACFGFLALACANRSPGKIVIVDFKNYDPTTVLMHEVGHVIGVDHINGDALMSRTTWDFKPLKMPTPAAIAAARGISPE